MEIKTSVELMPYLTEKYYIIIFGCGKDNQHLHNGRCKSMEFHKQVYDEFGKTKTRKQYFVFDTSIEAIEKYFENRSEKKSIKHSNGNNPYCHMCLATQHAQWIGHQYTDSDIGL